MMAVNHRSEIDGILTPSGKKLFPGLYNSFAENENTPWYKKHVFSIAFLVIAIVPLVTSLSFFMKTDVQDLIFSPEAFDFGDISFSSASRQRVIEIDEIFGNLYIKEKKVEEDVKTGSSATEGTGTGSGDGYGEGTEDLAFMPGISPPRPIGRLRKVFPEVARQAEVEATVYTEIIIDRAGIVRVVKPLYVNLNKQLPADQQQLMKTEFAKAAKATLKGARFTTVEINGKVVPVKMELPLQFEIN